LAADDFLPPFFLPNIEKITAVFLRYMDMKLKILTTIAWEKFL